MIDHQSTDVDALRDEIRQTRADLGDTVQALAAKADVKARVKGSAVHARARLVESVRYAATRVRGAAGMPDRERLAVVRNRLVAVGGSVRQRPVPWLVAGGGAAVAITVFAMNRRRR